jgi:hypothetical protein
MVSNVVNKPVNNKTNKTKSNSNKAKKNNTSVKTKNKVKTNKKAPHISGGFDLTPLISAILLAGIKLSIKQNNQNKKLSKHLVIFHNILHIIYHALIFIIIY